MQQRGFGFLLQLAIVICAVRSAITGRSACIKKKYPFNTEKFVNSTGYPFEIHSVTTTDGYILEIDRIAFGKNSTSKPNVDRPIVLLMPGGLLSSDSWIIAGPDRGLGFLLAEQGYDVWMGNTRGSALGRQHTSFNPDFGFRFWTFSLQELGVFDLSATIDYIIAYTNQTKLSYVGFSQGAAIMFILLSERPEYNSKIKVASSISAGVYTDHKNSYWNSQISLYNKFMRFIPRYFQFFEVHKFSQRANRKISRFCKNYNSTFWRCKDLKGKLGDPTKRMLDMATIAKIYPAGSSSGPLWHFIQGHNTGRFAKFNFGRERNFQLYGRRISPSYELKKVTIPVFLYVGSEDSFISFKRLQQLGSEISNTQGMYEIKGFNHMELMWAEEAVSALYTPLMNAMEGFK